MGVYGFFDFVEKSIYPHKRGSFVGLQPCKLSKTCVLHRIRKAWWHVFAQNSVVFQSGALHQMMPGKGSFPLGIQQLKQKNTEHMEFKDYYVILGITPEATEQEIKQAYRSLVRQHHPDVNNGNKEAEERFKEISEANYVLGNATRRKQYDTLRLQYYEWQQTQQTAGASGTDPSFNPFAWDWFGLNFFSNFFSGFLGREVQSRYESRYEPVNSSGSDLEMSVEITLEEAWKGTDRLVEVENRRIKVYIPPGVQNNTELVVEGQGCRGSGRAAPGNLYLIVEVKPHEHFDREGNHLYAELPVDMYTAILGGDISVPTLNGTETLTIPACVQTDQVFCLSGKGMPLLRRPTEFGNLYVRVKVFLPDPMSDDELKTLRKLARKHCARKI
jgi:curved DNA-binding protein